MGGSQDACRWNYDFIFGGTCRLVNSLGRELCASCWNSSLCGAMANIVLSARHANQWTFNELAGLNIRIETVAAPSFFGSALPDPQADPTLLAHPVLIENLTHPSEAISKDISLFFRYLRHATRRFTLGPATTLLPFCYECWTTTNPSASFINAWSSN